MMYINIYKRNIRKKKLRRRRRQKRRKMKTKAPIQSFFTIDSETYKDKGIVVFDFDDSRANEFVERFVVPFRKSYISDDDLDFEVDNNINTKEDAIENKRPTTALLKAGEFAEILFFMLVCKVICADSTVKPIKWRWKENRDTPCHLTDIMVMRCESNANPQATDYVFSAEVKSAATPIGDRSTKSRMNEAIEGALKDKNSRIGKMVAYLTTKYSKERNAEMALRVKRFEDGTTVPYERKISAAVISERDSLKNHVKNITAENLGKCQAEQITLFAVPIEKLKDIYETIYKLTPTKG